MVAPPSPIAASPIPGIGSIGAFGTAAVLRFLNLPLFAVLAVDFILAMFSAFLPFALGLIPLAVDFDLIFRFRVLPLGILITPP